MTTEKEAPPAGEGIAYDDRFCAICGSARHDWRSFVIGEGDSARICDSCLHDLGCDIEWRERAEKAESDLHREAERRAEDVAKIEQDYKLMLDYSHDESADLGKKLDAAEAECDALRAQLATLSRCARAYLSAVDHYLRSLVKQRVMHQPHDDVAAQVMNLAEKELLAALDSSGGEGEKAK